MSDHLTVAISELVAGDTVIDSDGHKVYVVIEILRDEPDEKLARVQWADGGFDVRAWDPENFSHEVRVRRV